MSKINKNNTGKYLEKSVLDSKLNGIKQEQNGVKQNIDSIINYPMVVEEKSFGVYLVRVFGVGEKGIPIEAKLKVTNNNIQNFGSKKLPRIKKILEKSLGAKLSKFIKNKNYRKALYFTFIRLGLDHVETIEETAFYISEMYQS